MPSQLVSNCPIGNKEWWMKKEQFSPSQLIFIICKAVLIFLLRIMQIMQIMQPGKNISLELHKLRMSSLVYYAELFLAKEGRQFRPWAHLGGNPKCSHCQSKTCSGSARKVSSCSAIPGTAERGLSNPTQSLL